MVKSTTTRSFVPVTLQPDSATPLYRQLYNELRDAMLSGRLAAGTRLPSTRWLADELDLSRNTIVATFEQLLAEGYLESRVGDGTYVTHALPDYMLKTHERLKVPIRRSPKGRYLSRRGALLSGTRINPPYIDSGNGRNGEPPAFRTGVPALTEFPFKLWAQLEARHMQRTELLAYGDPAGYKPLREAIAGYVREARAVRCDGEQVIIVSGAQQAFDLAARILLDPGENVWMENPGYTAARGALSSAGAALVPVPVDVEGLDVNAGIALDAVPRLIYVTPSHQHPLGVTMSLTRRIALLDYANRVGAWIIEDDYDSEYRYSSRPLAALQGLDSENRVIYVGTFSKVLFPSLRIGYVVVPPDLVDAFVSARAILDRHSLVREQAVIADFIAEGYFTLHIRRMRALYAERQDYLVSTATSLLGDRLEIPAANAGIHLIGWLPTGMDDAAASRHVADYGIEATPLSFYYMGASSIGRMERGGFVLGYACLDKPQIDLGLRKLATALQSLPTPHC